MRSAGRWQAEVRLSFVPHLLIEGSQQDIAQQRRYDSALRSSSWSFVTATLIFIAGLQHLLNKPQHPAVSDLLSDKSQQSIVIHGSKIIFQIRIHYRLVSGLHFTPDLG